MSDSSEQPWSDNPYAPRIPPLVHAIEKSNFTGDFFAAILYGVVVVLFFQCMSALLDPANRKTGGTKWGLVVHTATMFSTVTIATALGLNLQSNSYIDDREFSSNIGLPPGPIGYKLLLYRNAFSIVPSFMFYLNQWLADGLLLYRCYVIYAMNYWVIAFPCLVYLASVVMGILYITQNWKSGSFPVHINLGVPYFSISLALNIILTLVIVARLILHSRNLREATGAPATTGRLYNTIITMLIESCALYAVALLLYIGSYWADAAVVATFWSILTEAQVIAPFLITLRVANRRALTGSATVSGNVGSIHFMSQGGSTTGEGTLSDGYSTNPMGADGESGEFGASTETATDLRLDKDN